MNLILKKSLRKCGWNRWELLNWKLDAFIGVHSTHGVNRCGYLICRYLIEKLNWPAQKAIDEFNKNRGHQIEHKNYIDDLIAANWNDPPKKEKPEGENTSEVKVVRSVSLNVPQDSVEKPPATGDFEKMKTRRHSAYPRQDAVEDSTRQEDNPPWSQAFAIREFLFGFK